MRELPLFGCQSVCLFSVRISAVNCLGPHTALSLSLSPLCCSVRNNVFLFLHCPFYTVDNSIKESDAGFVSFAPDLDPNNFV